MTKSFSMAGWRVAYMVGNAEVVAALTDIRAIEATRGVARIDRQRLLPVQIAEAPAIVHAHDVIRVRVGIEHRIHFLNIRP